MSPKVSEDYKRKKKMDIMQAARKVFIKKGYTDATMRDVMDEAKVSRGALYAYFDNIDHVFIEVLQMEDKEDILFFEPDDESSLWNQLADWLKLQQKNIEGINDSLVLAKAEFFLTSKYARGNKNAEYITERYNSLKSAINRFIKKGINQGEFQPQLDSEHIAYYFISFLDGLMLDTFQLGPRTTNVKEQLEVFQFSLRKMLFSSGKE